MNNNGPSAYRHSETFARLKSIEEAIPNNLSSVEYLTTLDALLYNAILPILESSNFFDLYLVKLLAWQATNPRRKSTSCAKEDIPSLVTLFLVAGTPKIKLITLRKIGFDRGLLCEGIRRWLGLSEQYVEIMNTQEVSAKDQAKAERLLIALGSSEDRYPIGAYHQVEFWYGRFSYFKSLILEKYTRLCLNTAQMDYVRLNCRVDLEDIIQTYLMTASKAIDKCDASRGVLTTHVQHWLMSARNVISRDYLDEQGQRKRPDLTVAPNLRKETESFVQEHEKETAHVDHDNSEEVLESVADSVERTHGINRVRQIARYFDPVGYARLILGIDEFVTPQMKHVLEQRPVNIG